MARATKSRARPASELDRQLGRRLARRRQLMGKTPAELDEAIAAPQGSVEAFERGTQSMDAGHLFALSRALGVPVLYFFENVPRPTKASAERALDPRRIREAELFINAYLRIPDRRLRRDILGLLKAAGSQRNDDGNGNGNGDIGPGG